MSVVARLEPSILVLLVKRSATMLPLHYKAALILFYFNLYRCQLLDWNLTLRIMSQLFYHCTTRIQCCNFMPFLSHMVPVEGFDPSILGLWVKSSTTVLPAKCWNFLPFLPLGGSVMNRTPSLMIISQNFYHCATSTTLNILHFSLSKFQWQDWNSQS